MPFACRKRRAKTFAVFRFHPGASRIERKESKMATIFTWLAVIGLMNDSSCGDMPSRENQPVLLIEDESSAISPFARERSSFVPPWHDRNAIPDPRLPIPSRH